MTVQALAASIAMLTALSASAAWRAQQTPFRSAVDVVSVDVSVRKGNTPVRNLGADAFVLSDNGVRQTIEVVSVEAVPLDVTVMLDASGSTTDLARRFRDGTRRIASLLSETDRVRFIAFAADVQELAPMGSPATTIVRDVEVTGSTSLYDALLHAFAWIPSVERRHLIVLFTDGYENSSLLEADTVMRIASRSEAVLYAILPTRSLPKTVSAFFPVARARQVVIDAASASGGGAHFMQEDEAPIHDAASASDRDARSAGALERAFREILGRYRASYLLRYRAAGVPRKGWHDIVVRVVSPDSAKYTVQARKGYFGG